jgi:3,4-dihydroxy 2-butanone 4-phosphate synthase/GTP cyclohydrolase II
MKGDVQSKDDVLVRIHSECITGDVLGSLRCDCGTQLEMAMSQVAERDEGIIIYLRGHEGRGIGITQKLRAYELQDRGMDTVEANLQLGFPADARNYTIAAQILKHLRVKSISLLTNNPSKIVGLEGFSFAINHQIPLKAMPTQDNLSYLMTKQEKMGHLLNL